MLFVFEHSFFANGQRGFQSNNKTRLIITVFSGLGRWQLGAKMQYNRVEP